jgi:DNA polymerase III subunit alpha
MNQTPFIHLRLHTEYSIQDSTISIDKAISTAKIMHMPALAISDINNGFGWIKFYQAARKNAIKPIIGVDITVDDKQMLCLVQNNTGYLNLCKILSISWQNAQSDSSTSSLANISLDQMLAISSNLEGLIILLGCPQSSLYQNALNVNIDNTDKLEQELIKMQRILGDRLYIELQYNNDSNTIWPLMTAMSAKLNIPLAATHAIQFIAKEDYEAHEIRVCVSAGDTISNTSRKSKNKFNEQQYFKSIEEMQIHFAALPSALQNTVEIAKRCNLTLNLGKPQLPNFPIPDGYSVDSFLYDESLKGLNVRLAQDFNNSISEHKNQEYLDRLKFEVDTINHMGFAGYFLIVADFINWAKNNDVPVGPGRGSGAGSIVAYALGITDIDPLPYNLLFERFLNPERVSMPDFDIDFCQQGRDKVIQYVKDKYGVQAVSQIATFGTMAAKAAIRDVGRVLELGYNFVDGVAKLIPFKPTKHVTIASSLEEEPTLAQRYADEEDVKILLDMAQSLEGLTRNVGMHAGGVLIAPNKLTDFCPLYTQDGANIISQYDKDDVESSGLVKFDFLGLTTLTILKIAQQYVRKLFDANFDYQRLELTNTASFDILKKGNTVGVFQLESRGMQGMLKDALPDRFEDIIALVSLYRPGPMDLIPTYIARKHKREEVIYPDPRVEPVLKETYGIMVYQEQVMQMAQIIGGYTLGGADLLRRAMGKKKLEEMMEHREIFRAGAATNGLTATKADEIFDLMEKFAGYGFNKSHATAYALIAYHTAWFKANYIECFMAANLSLAMDDTDKIGVLMQDCVNNNITILAPDIHTSEYSFIPIINNTSDNNKKVNIVYGLGAIKGLGKAAIEYIIMERAKGQFTSFLNFAERIDKRLVNKRSFEALIKSGAFDCFGDNRGTLMHNVDMALELASQIANKQSQVSLFDNIEQADAPLPQLIINEWDKKTSLIEEKSVLGFYFSGHLFDIYSEKAKSLIHQSIEKTTAGKDKVIVGIITSLRTQLGNRGKMMILTINDKSANIECVVYAELLESAQIYIKQDACVYIKGEVKFDNFIQAMRINATQLCSIEQAHIMLARSITITVEQPTKLIASELMTKLQEHGVALRIKYKNTNANATNNNIDCTLLLPPSHKLPLSTGYLAWFEALGINYVIE